MKILSQRQANFQQMKGKYPEVIYKYREWQHEKHKKVITEQELYCSPPSDFNDPKDCKGAVRYDLLKPKEKIEFIVRKLKENYKGHRGFFYHSEARRIFKTSPLKDNDNIINRNKEDFDEFDKCFGVLCLTPNHKIIKMWEDYADDHQGFCIGYYSEYLFEQLGGGCKVIYEKELPIIYPAPVNRRSPLVRICNPDRRAKDL